MTAKVTAKVTAKNVGAGHSLPTGLTDLRRMWLQVSAVPGDGAAVPVGRVEYHPGGAAPPPPPEARLAALRRTANAAQLSRQQRGR